MDEKMKHKVITNELMKRNFYISKADREKIIAMGQKAMDDYNKALHVYNIASYLWITPNNHLIDKLTIQYYVINLN
ncbi:hypothetical protein [Chryseobacterium sp. HR92]|uniref:hypothetical protein n=1 Tax=Chryseobacterium sp. HR92 TaxID=3094839 RepID=UPI00388D57A1|nr:hypothetical protein SFA27_16750 [Chryseobacterium sp. HR92]